MFRPEVLGDVLLWDSKLPQVLPTLGPNIELALVMRVTKAFFAEPEKFVRLLLLSTSSEPQSQQIRCINNDKPVTIMKPLAPKTPCFRHDMVLPLQSDDLGADSAQHSYSFEACWRQTKP